LRGLPQRDDPNLLVGSATADDAGVYRIDERRALVQTVDFFTPVVDDGYWYGQIAAANALSDVYAMGGRPLTAMALLGLPDEVGLDVANAILRGGAEKVMEAECCLAGGHSIQNPEPLYGLSVTGLVDPACLMTNAAAEEGDVLVLTKPLGMGIVSTAIKRGEAEEGMEARAIKLMAALNKEGAELGERRLVKGATDITGFGLLGHLLEMCRGSGVGAELDYGVVPLMDEAVRGLAEAGCVPGGTRKNLLSFGGEVDFGGLDTAGQLILADAQTSGGLLLSVPEFSLRAVMELLEERGASCAVVIGRVLGGGELGGKLVRVV
jgi:selenide, water dikinase